MRANIYSSSVIFVNHMAVKLKREADSLEVDIQIFIIVGARICIIIFC